MHRRIALSLLGMLGLVLTSSCSNTLSPATRQDIADQVMRRQASIQACYQEILGRRPALSGRMDLSFTVEPGTGKVSNVTVAPSRMKAGNLKRCVLQQIQGITVGSPPEVPVHVTYPIVFQNG